MELSDALRLPVLLAATLLTPAVVEAEHTSNWAVLVSTSRFWFNYRHLANVLSIYRTVKRLGIPDSQIILMLPDDMACNPRNAFPGTVYSNADRAVDLYGDNIEVDYRGYEVTVENFIRLLTDRVGDEMPRSKRLLTDDRSNILVYMTGHGGAEFLKFQDAEEIGAFDLADAFEQMWEKKRYHEILFMIDTCQANTMYSKLYSPNIIATGSSELDQSSYSHHADNDVGVAVIDRYTYYNLEFLEAEVRDTSSKKTVGDLFDSYSYEKIHSNAGVRYDLFPGGAEAARSRLLTDFFGNVQNVEVDDGSAKNSTLEEDLLGLSRTIAALRKKADEEDALAPAAATRKKITTPQSETKENKTAALSSKKHSSQFAKPLTDDNWWTKKIFGATAFLPLRHLTLHSRPLANRPIKFSCDGELAVAADDSVHVFVPEFPDVAKQARERKERRRLRRLRKLEEEKKNAANDSTSPPTTAQEGAADTVDVGQSKALADGDDDEEDDSENGEEDEEDEEDSLNDLRAQYSEGSRHLPVSYPPLDPRMNRELFYNLGMEFPYDDVEEGDGEQEGDENEEEDAAGSTGQPKHNSRAGTKELGLDGADSDEEGDEEEDDDEDDDDEEDEDEDGEGDVIGGRRPRIIPNGPFGAGYGAITSTGSSMNHVVNMDWSPSGLGANRRPILAILTGSGTLAMYGDGSTPAKILPRVNEGMLQHRELNSWEVLWGVGERLIAPGQQVEVSEYLRGFSWAKEIAPGQALLATISDQMEVAILTVQTVFRPDPDQQGQERLVWLVQEVARFVAKGPHDRGDMLDPDYVPYGTSFGLNWTPWHHTKDSMASIISFVDRNYIGFRKITVKTPWVRGELPLVEVDKEDIFGKCVHLSVNSFVEFENAILSQEDITKCRGIVVSGCKTMPFEIALSGGTSYSHKPHTPRDCGTVYPPVEANGSQNKIADLVIHRPDPANVKPTPLYTLVRMSATIKTRDWYESNIEDTGIPSDGETSEVDDTTPQWVRDIQEKINISVPANMQMRYGFEGESDSENEEESETDDEMDENEWEDEDDEDEDEDEDEEDNTRTPIPEIHPHRYRLHGLAVSSGGGVTAVLASQYSTQHPERGGWHTVRSTIMFAYNREQTSQPKQDPSPAPSDDIQLPQLTTEGKLFEWLYGGGPPVPGVNFPAPPQTDSTDAGNPEDTNLKTLFQPIVEKQTCDLCGTKMTPNKRGQLSGCEQGHFFGTCATSRLAVQMPGITRSCGACGLRTIRTEELVQKIPPEQRDGVFKALGEGVCGGCSGKFLI
ncbi:gpi-anchor transamidase-like protein [Rhypophila decipiens]|uniref:Gpi-anchor transamidase-like protein n=1 Tax=Rhypophila decipiens TaxID=261697 RepID=A0AAN7B1P3_9PEZI|nr:gpi-anchor transamidase-like protein [Rhypophila decipiens]